LRNDDHEIPFLERMVDYDTHAQDFWQISAKRIDLLQFSVCLVEQSKFDLAMRRTQVLLVRVCERD
jgi:hypothetical protein